MILDWFLSEKDIVKAQPDNKLVLLIDYIPKALIKLRPHNQILLSFRSFKRLLETKQSKMQITLIMVWEFSHSRQLPLKYANSN